MTEVTISFGRPVPVVLDAMVLADEIAQAARRPHRTALWSCLNWGHIRVFITHSVLEETLRRLEERIVEKNLDRESVVQTAGDYIGRISVVDNFSSADPRAMAVAVEDPDDAPTAALVTLLAPAVLLTRDSHFEPLGIEIGEDWLDVVRAARYVRTTDDMGTVAAAGIQVAGLGVAGVAHAARRLPMLTGFTAVGLLIWAYLRPDQVRKVGRGAATLARTFSDMSIRLMLSDHDAAQIVSARVVRAANVDDPAAKVARYLARADEPQTWDEIVAGAGVPENLVEDALDLPWVVQRDDTFSIGVCAIEAAGLHDPQRLLDAFRRGEQIIAARTLTIVPNK